jgi:cell division protein FtsW
VVVYSISPGLAASQGISQNYFITKQLIDVALGLTAFVLAAFLPSSWWWRVAGPLAVAAIVASALVMLVPTDALHPAHRWIRVGGFSFQVVELIKLALLVWTAKFLTLQWQGGKLGDFSGTLRTLLIVTLAAGVVVAGLQSDLGSAGVVIAIVGLMAYVSGIPLKKIGLIAGLISILLVLAIASSPYRRERLTTFLNPQADCQDSGYQACQSLISVGSGGLLGLGLGHSVQAYGYQPEAGNDSIFAIFAEKFGFIGSVALLVIYGALIYRLKLLITHSASQFNRLLAVGVLAWLSTQIIINVGAMLGILPLKGITLPYVSQGGTSLIFLTAALGMAFQISRYTSYSKIEPKISEAAAHNYSNGGRGLRRAHNPVTFARPRT